MFNLNQKTAVITGAGSGIVKATAKVLARQGAIIYALDLNEGAVADTIREINESGGQSFPLVCNVTDQAQVKDVLAQTKAIDILVNCAGISHIGKADNTSEEDFDRIYQVNVKGTYNCLHEAIPLMKDKGGVILNMASIANNVGLPDRFAYSMSKGAVLGMTLSVAKDYLANGIRCNCISPARVHTPFVDNFLAKTYPGQEAEMFEKLSKTQPIGRMARPEEIANLILYLCSDEASFITGCDYPIDGGFIKLNN
jgi:NAD(P)-dependent dehydrogenase (short-subunit alcohol dehydrogenase family)